MEMIDTLAFEREAPRESAYLLVMLKELENDQGISCFALECVYNKKVSLMAKWLEQASQ